MNHRHEIVSSDPAPVLSASFSEGSVIAYYLSEFHVPTGQEASVDKAMAAMDKLVDKEQRNIFRAGNSLLFDDVVSSGRVLREIIFPTFRI